MALSGSQQSIATSRVRAGALIQVLLGIASQPILDLVLIRLWLYPGAEEDAAGVPEQA